MFVGHCLVVLVRVALRPVEHPVQRPVSLALSGLAAVLLGACSQDMDWREMQPAGAHVRVAMPCRPASQQRKVPLAGAAVEMTLVACHVEQGTFALSFAEVHDPSRVGPALQALTDSARSNVQGQTMTLSPAQVRGMTPQPQAQQWRVSGTLPDGRPVLSQGVVFAHGTRVYQATIVGARPGDEAVRTFFNALMVQP